MDFSQRPLVTYQSFNTSSCFKQCLSCTLTFLPCRAYHLFTDFQLQRLALRGVSWCKAECAAIQMYIDVYIWPLQGVLVYYIFFWLLTAVVVVSAGLCLFVAHNFKTNNFPYIW